MKTKNENKGFRITRNKGIHITFSNGWTVSVQFGAGNYCDNYNSMDFINPSSAESNTAEIWAWNKDVKKHYPRDPLGYQTPEQVLDFINKIRRKK